MATKTTPKPAAKPAAKRAAPPTAPAAPAGPKTGTDGEGNPTVEITFTHRQMWVRGPDEAQLTLLIAAERYYQQLPKHMARLEGLPHDISPDDPRVVEGERLVADAKKHIVRLGDIIGSLFVDPFDWEWIEDGMAARSIKWQEVAELPTLIMRAMRDDEVPSNRAAKRATKGKAFRG